MEEPVRNCFLFKFGKRILRLAQQLEFRWLSKSFIYKGKANVWEHIKYPAKPAYNKA